MLGGEDIKKGELADGHFVSPVIADLPRGHHLFQDELFSPFLVVDTFDTLEEAVREGGKSQYMDSLLEFSVNQKMACRLFHESHMEAGIFPLTARLEQRLVHGREFSLSAAGKEDGSTGKGGCGPYYVSHNLCANNHKRE